MTQRKVSKLSRVCAQVHHRLNSECNFYHAKKKKKGLIVSATLMGAPLEFVPTPHAISTMRGDQGTSPCLTLFYEMMRAGSPSYWRAFIATPTSIDIASSLSPF